VPILGNPPRTTRTNSFDPSAIHTTRTRAIPLFPSRSLIHISPITDLQIALFLAIPPRMGLSMDISGDTRFLPKFVLLDAPQNAALLYPGMRIPLNRARKIKIERYVECQEKMQKFMDKIGSYERDFLLLTATGFWIPRIPRMLGGFRPFGKGFGGFVRTTFVGSLFAGYGAHVITPRSSDRS
jgi:hypothetical protein